MNRYSYVLNNALKYVDPSGHCALLEDEADGLCVRTASDGKPRVVHGGSVFVNPVEVALANAVFSGDPIYLSGIPAGVDPSSIHGSMKRVAAEFGISSGSNARNLLLFGSVAFVGAWLASSKGGSNSVGAQFGFDAKTGQYRDLSTGRFVSPRDLPWPSNRGFANKPVDTILPEGAVIDRYGRLTGQYAGTPGATTAERGMAPGTENMPYTKLEVIKSLTVPGGPAAAVPEFGASGGSMQYFFAGGIQKWIDEGYLRILS